MPAPTRHYPLRRGYDDPVEHQAEYQAQSRQRLPGRQYSNEARNTETSPDDWRAQTSPMSSTVSLPAQYENDISEPASLENQSRHSSGQHDENKSEDLKAKRPGWWARLKADTWTLELIAGLISLAAIGSIVGLLFAYDQKPVPPLMKGITLNAVIAFLATISRTAIMFCIATVLSQGKWLCFKKERSLIDLQSVDNASRGPLGSILMILSLRGGMLRQISAFLVIATLGFDPFVQQLLTIQDRVVSVPANGISVNSTTSMTVNIYSAMDYPETAAQLTAAMLAEVQQEDQPESVLAQRAVSDLRMSAKRSGATAKTLASPLTAECPSGDCVWQPYYALDICSQCRDTTKEVALKNLSPQSSDMTAIALGLQSGELIPEDSPFRSNFTWEIVPKFGFSWQVSSNLSVSVLSSGSSTGGPVAGSPYYLVNSTNNDPATGEAYIVHKVVWPLNFANTEMDVSLDTTGWTKQAFAGIDEPVAAIGFAEFNLNDYGVPVLNNSLECAITYCVKEYSRSVVRGNLVTDVASTHYGKVTEGPAGLGWVAHVNNTNFTVDSIIMYGAGIGTMASYLLGDSTHGYQGDCTINGTGICPLPVTSNGGTYNASYPQAWQGVDLTPDFATVLNNVQSLLSDIVQWYGNVSVAGDNAITKTFVLVRWEWIALPAAIVFFGLLVLLRTVWETSRLKAPKWKSSLLPLLYRYAAVDDASAEGERSSRPAPPPPSQLRPALVGHFASSNLVSNFEVEAKATKTRLTKESTGWQVWRLQSLETIHQASKRWWRRK